MKTSVPSAILLAAAFTTALALTGCVTKQLSVENRATGQPQQTFAQGEVPTVVARGGVTGMGGTKIEVFGLPDRELLVTEVIPSSYDEPQTSTYLPDSGGDLETFVFYPNWRPVHKMPLPGLPPGDYVAELSYDGRIQGRVPFTVAGAGGQPAAAPAAAGVRRGPEIYAPSGISREEAMVGWLDAMVGLTNDQRTNAAKIYAEQHNALDRFYALKDGAMTPSEIAASTRTRIRAMLTPDQQMKFDDGLRPKPSITADHSNAPGRAMANGGAFMPTGSPDIGFNRAIRAYIAYYLEHSPAIAARVGLVVRVRPAGSRTRTERYHGVDPSRSGSDVYFIDGSDRSETVKVLWERSSKEPFKILRIEGTGGAIIPI